MKVQEQRVFRIPLEDLRDVIHAQYGVSTTNLEASLEKDFVVFTYELDSISREALSSTSADISIANTSKHSRKRRRKRNRIKTRGWKVIGKITNSNGLLANIYEPLVNNLKDRDITRTEQRKLVRNLMVSNGNNPSGESVDYFLNNTLEFIAQTRSRQEVNA